MGKDTFTKEAYSSARETHVPRGSASATHKAEQTARRTGKLNPLVDPSGYGVIRRSLLRLTQQEDTGLWEVTVGTPVPIETRVDTTGSMGNNVDIAMDVLPSAFEQFARVLPDYDIQVATGIFGDVTDSFVLCRPQFEMVAHKIVEQLTLMVPCRDGGDSDEDPHYGLFGGAYLTDAYINRIGLKGYDFTISDAAAHDAFDERQLKRIFGDDIFTYIKTNGHQITPSKLPTIKSVVTDLQKRAHAFFLQVGSDADVHSFWSDIFGPNRVIALPDTRLTPYVQALIIGLTEGTLNLQSIDKFLSASSLDRTDIRYIKNAVAQVPLNAQAILPNYSKRPKAGDLFREKTDLWPIDPKDKPKPKDKKKVDWV